MHFDDSYQRVGESLYRFQSALNESGSSLAEFIERSYLQHWRSDTVYHVMAIRTSFVTGMQDHLIRKGLLNLERVQMSLLTDPLAHDVEHLPAIPYKGQPYVTTHSMIYSKFLACMNPRLTGIFVDSPNIRLEIAAPDGSQRGKYLIDFSQLDVEVRRNRGIDLDTYLGRPEEVTEILREDYRSALRLFEEMFRAGVERILERNQQDLDGLEVRLDLPSDPFPLFYLDEGLQRYGKHDVEAGLGRETDAPFFWIGGLMRENYDLIYPYLQPGGGRKEIRSFTSREIYNYDLLVKSTPRDGGATSAREVLSGAVREWIPEAIVARLLDNRIIPVEPVIRDGMIENIDELGGYGPFLMVALARDAEGRPLFPDTFGAGIGIERALWAMLRGPKVQKIEDVTCFGKNPDSHPLYLF